MEDQRILAVREKVNKEFALAEDNFETAVLLYEAEKYRSSIPFFVNSVKRGIMALLMFSQDKFPRDSHSLVNAFCNSELNKKIKLDIGLDEIFNELINLEEELDKNPLSISKDNIKKFDKSNKQINQFIDQERKIIKYTLLTSKEIKNKKIKIKVAFAVIGILAGLMVIYQKNVKALFLSISQQAAELPAGQIIKGREVGQTFYCSHNNLACIEVKLATYKRRNRQDVFFRLKKSPTAKKDIFKQTFNASDVRDNTYRSFNFPTIPDSKGKTYYFSFKSPRSKKGDAITIWGSNNDRYKKGSLYINKKKEMRDLAFKTYYYNHMIIHPLYLILLGAAFAFFVHSAFRLYFIVPKKTKF